MRRPLPNRFAPASILTAITFMVVAILQAQSPHAAGGQTFYPNGMLFPNENGTSSTISTTGRIDLTGPFFQSLGTNGRACASCHQPSDGMSVSAAHIQQRFDLTQGLDPIFRTNDGSNCDSSDVSTLDGRRNAYSLLRTRGLIRVSIGVPGAAGFSVTANHNQYGCTSTTDISQYRRPLPSTNLRFLSAVMWDGRESAGARKIVYDAAHPNNLLIANLMTQSLDATNGHAQGAGLHPNDTEKQQIVDFEMGLTTAQATVQGGGRLNAQGANGGPETLATQPFFISINSSVDFIQDVFFHVAPSGFAEKPGGLTTPGDRLFDQNIFNMFDAWAALPSKDPRAAIARGQTLFNTIPIPISGVAGINDAPSVNGLGVPDGTVGTCGTCHDTPNVGDHSFPTPLDIGTGDLMDDDETATVNKGGLDISYLPKIKVCRNSNPGDCKVTTDLGQALIDGNYDHVGKIKGPILRGLSARAPYFHNGSAKTLLDVVHFYETRFGFVLTAQQESDLVAFLSSL